ncbi:hypothetical protein ABEY48_20335 [Bacillus mycoides]|uniref:hypothetical protein n=1 Tax=Bacillus mycoides TaxID=1405 RepID=UPI003D22FF4D
MVNNSLTIKLFADTSEVLKQMKEIMAAAHECALEKLEKAIDRFMNKNEQKDIKFVMTLGEKAQVKSIVEYTADSIQGRVIKDEELRSEKK